MLRNLKRFIVVHFLLASFVYADTPAPGAVYIKGGTTNALIGNVGDSSKVNVTNTISATVSGTVPVTQGTSPWVTSISNFPSSQSVTQGTSPWVVYGNLGRTWTLNSGTDSVSFAGTVVATNPSVGLNAATLPTSSTLVGAQLGANLQPLQLNASKYLYVDGSQVTQPVSGTVAVSNFPGIQPVSGTVTANAGSGSFNVVQPLGTALHTNVDNFPSSQNVVVTNTPTVNAVQSGGWTTGRTWNLSSGSDSVTVGNSSFGVTQITNPWTVAGTVTANAGSGTFTVGQATGSNLHAVIDNFPSTFGVTQSTSPWLTSRNWTLNAGTDSVDVSNFPASQVVTQSTPANLNATVFQGTSPWVVSGSTTVSGTVTANQGTSPWVENVAQFGGNNVATGTGASGVGIPRVTVSNDSNILATQSGSWTTGRTWSLLNSTDSVNSVQSGSWTTGRTWDLSSGTDSVTTQIQSDGAPATQNITVVDSGSTTTAYANGQNFITGTPTAGSVATFALSSEESVEILMTGSPTGTFQTEISMDGGTTWFTRGLKQSGVTLISSSFTNNFQGGMNVSGMTNVRVRAVAAVTGTGTVKLVSSINPSSVTVSNALSAIQGRSVNITFTQSYSSANLSISAFTTIISSSSTIINEEDIFDNSGGIYYLAYASTCGGLSTSSNAVIINAGGGSKDFQIPTGMCVGFQAIGTAITTGNVYMTFYK